MRSSRDDREEPRRHHHSGSSFSGRETMHKTPEITRLIHDNFWIVISFAFARPVVGKVIEQRFKGEWKYLHRTVYELSEIRADRALLEMATQLRVLDDQNGLSDGFKETGMWPLGTVTQTDGATTDLHFRDMTNKIIHARSFEWNLSEPEQPVVICRSHNETRWTRAEISLVKLMGLIGSLMY
jgi:hypothetical protein